MAETKHTPGPLFYDPLTRNILPSLPGCAPLHPHPSNVIYATLSAGAPDDFGTQLARRYNAHANLLAACEFALCESQRRGFTFLNTTIRAAVAKARGE